MDRGSARCRAAESAGNHRTYNHERTAAGSCRLLLAQCLVECPSRGEIPTHTGGSIHSSPYAASGKSRNRGEARANGYTAEQMSWAKPGSVNSDEHTPPPMV